MTTQHHSSIGCLVIRQEEVLLVKHTYGPTQGRWDFIRGHVEPTESLESAAIREVQEESGVFAHPVKILAVRQYVKEVARDHVVNDLLIVWALDYVSGDPLPDGREISDAQFLYIGDALRASDVSNWTKELLRAFRTAQGLHESVYQPGRLSQGTRHWKLFTE